jgi:hypothetical protein
MAEPTLLDAFGISLHEILALTKLASMQTYGDRGRFARLLTKGRTVDAGAHIADQLWGCRQILSKVGLLNTIYLSQRLVREQAARPDWEQILEQIYTAPVAVRNRTIWLLFHSCLQAERDFALDACPARSHETFLTGRLVEKISAACASWAATAASYLERVEKALEVSSIDLSVAGGEQETGGDFALILDIKENPLRSEDMEPDVIVLTGPPRGDVFVPLVFQAKRYTGSTANISQKHSERGYQFNRLRQVRCASSFIFYENGEERIKDPTLPMVKPVSACEPVETSPNIQVFRDSVDFATYILRAVDGCDGIPAATTREDALNMILANTSPDRLSRIAVLGNTSGLDHQYEDALKRLMGEINSERDTKLPQRVAGPHG